MSKIAIKRAKWVLLIAAPTLLLAALFPAMRARREVAATRALLLECSQLARVPEIERLIVEGADINGICPKDCPNNMEQGETALYLSIRSQASDAPAVMKMLIDAGAEVNRANNSGGTPLMGAASLPSPAMVSLLIERGANVNQRTEPMKLPNSPKTRALSALDFNEYFSSAKFQRGSGDMIPPNELKRIREMLIKAGAQAQPSTPSQPSTP